MRALQQMLCLPRSAIVRLIIAGFVKPQRGPRNAYRFSFQDVVLLRTAHALRSAGVPQRRLMQALRQLADQLPPTLPLSGLRIQAVGDRIVVRSGDAAWDPVSGQLMLELDVSAPEPGSPVLQLRAVSRGPEEHEAPVTAAQWVLHAHRIEDSDPAAAEAAYRTALRAEPDCVAASLDLGALLCADGRSDEALALYDDALRVSPEDPGLHFNMAIVLEDQGRLSDALARYARCLQLDPALADAHYNSARLCERVGDARGALRHFSAYRRLERARDESAPESTGH